MVILCQCMVTATQEDSLNLMLDALDAAICRSVDMRVNPICVWDRDEKLLLVVIEGDVFDHQIEK
jgi:hypothetical protein